MKLLGILTVGESKGNIVETGSVTDGKREVKIVYDLGREGKTATLRIVFSEEGEKRFLDAEVSLRVLSIRDESSHELSVRHWYCALSTALELQRGHFGCRRDPSAKWGHLGPSTGCP
jgi:hypothetical protein